MRSEPPPPPSHPLSRKPALDRRNTSGEYRFISSRPPKKDK